MSRRDHQRGLGRRVATEPAVPQLRRTTDHQRRLALLYQGQVVYVVDVFSDDGAEHAGWGLPGRTVTFRVEGLPTHAQVAWGMGLVREVALTPTWRLFVPVIRR